MPSKVILLYLIQIKIFFLNLLLKYSNKKQILFSKVIFLKVIHLKDLLLKVMKNAIQRKKHGHELVRKWI